ncbi:type VI secretion system Vgr family protein [Thiorhodovibrio winogradskyi]|uniref:Type VI secretion system Vgr family protein n=1 Tax=Thiorhodovibrio winogradskyi TaxID=77007 RepID=A0ABZ0S7Y1_9GAMM|nr:type VI secretion system tip protein TssI/VgrG [Thiorhodovibrio winogradskyi]
MPVLKENAFTFVSKALPEDTFVVARFSGEEGLSMLYRFDVLLVSERRDLDLDAVLQNPATFTIKGLLGGKEDLPFHGILSAFDQMHQVDGLVFYRAELRPKAWWLTLTRHNQVFLNQSPEQFVAAVLEDGGLRNGLDFDFPLKASFPARDYVCQYGESHFDFFSRWMEFGGAYYWFEQDDKGEKLICSDSLIAHKTLPGFETLIYSEPSGLDATKAGQVITSFHLRQTPMPRQVLLKDYYYEKPSLEMKGQAQVAANGRGEMYLYGDHVLTQAGAAQLARIRAEEIRCREKIFHGLSSVPGLRPGFNFKLNGHYRQDFNQAYLTTLVRHEGSQERYLVGGLGFNRVSDQNALFYRNTFECIPATTQYRPPRKTPKPRIAGTLSAKIDASQSGQYAELDDAGRYKVILPFDLSGREDGKASAWLRMATPYAGENYGMHFPLLKGTEVLISFDEGDIDRPTIVAAIHNPETPNLVTSKNHAVNAIRTAGGNELALGDEHGKSYIGMKLPASKGSLVMAESGEGESDEGKSTFFNVVDGHFEGSFDHKTEVTIGTSNEAVGGVKNEVFAGGKGEVQAGLAWEACIGQSFGFTKGDKIEFGSESFSYHDKNEMLGEDSVEIKAGLNLGSRAAVQKLKKAFLAAIATTLAGSASTMTTMQGIRNPKDMYSEGTANTLKWVGATGVGLASLFGAGLMAYIRSTMKGIETAQSGDYAAVMELSKDHGVKVEVDNSVGPQAKLTMKVGNAGNSSSIEIASEGEKITLTNKSALSIVLEDGKTLTAKKTTPQGDVVITIGSRNSILLKCPDGGSFEVSAQGVLMQKLKGGGFFQLDTNKIMMQASASENLTLNKTSGISLKSSKFAGKTTGPMQLDGGIIKLG